MREYFNDILNNLDTLAGLRQLENIHQSVGGDRGKAITEINKLLDALCNVSKLFPFIPEAEQQKIINQAVITTPREEFPNLNANLVYRWLNRHKDKYFKESHHVPEVKAEPLTGEARQAKLKEWLAEVDKIGKGAPIVSERDPRFEWLRKRPAEMQELGYTPPTDEAVTKHNLHIQWIKENYDPYTGKPKEGWISEEEWLKTKLGRV